jgi:hypothetical protein
MGEQTIRRIGTESRSEAQSIPSPPPGKFKNKLSPYARASTYIGILRRRDENPRRGSTKQGDSLAEMGVAEGNGATALSEANQSLPLRQENLKGYTGIGYGSCLR